MNTIVFSDIDGTLLNSRHEITPLTRYAIQALGEAGIPFVIISARSPSGIYPITGRYGFCCPLICYSGGLILDSDGTVLYDSGLSKTDAERIADYISDRFPDVTLCAYSLDDWIVKDKSDPRVIREEGIVKAVSREGTIASAAGKYINKLLCICPPEILPEVGRAVKSAFPECAAVPSSDILLEIMKPRINKASAAKLMCGIAGVPLSHAIAFGDNYNDAEMLEAVGCGILMGNAPEGMKTRIPRHTRDNDSDGIYYSLLDMGIITECRQKP